MIVHSMVSLFWLLCLLVALLYTVAIILTQGCNDYLFPKDGTAGELFEPIDQAYGTLFKTMYTLFKSMTSGVSWGEMADLLLPVGHVYFIVFVIYIFFTLFSVLNIVTGVFVDSAIQIAQRDRGVLREKNKRSKDATTTHLLQLLQDLDEDNSG